ncbi:C6 zinc cluster transcription factor-like protein, partial [Teratosphaeriaceae sp. CCFEE 6253]
YGTQQAKQLATHLLQVDPPVDLIYSSPFYRCLQTLAPFTDAIVAQKGDGKVKVITEPGVGEFYGKARFDHPSPASLEVLHTHFPHLQAERETIIVPSTKGETIPQLHD